MAQGRTDNLEAFAKRVATIVQAGGNTDSMERLVARLITNKKTPQIAAQLAQKWVEWRYGKNETHKHELNVKVEMTVHDADSIIAGYFGFAASRTDQISESDQSQATKQDNKLLPQ